MKSLLALTLLTLLSTNAFAKGEVSLKVREDMDAKKEHAALALEVDEHVVGPLGYHSYSSLGDAAKGQDGFRMLTSHQLDLAIKKFTVSPGAALKYASDGKNFDKEVFVKVGYQVW